MTTPFSSDLQLACRYVAGPEHDVVFDYLSESLMLERTKNLSDFAAVLAFDKWGGQRGRTPGRVQQGRSRPQIYRDIHRPGLLL